MRAYLSRKHCHCRIAALFGAAWLALGSPAHSAAAQNPAKTSVATAYPVLINATGRLTDLYFTAGDRVHRGQLLAKVERPDGNPFYVNAPVTGRITASWLTLDGAYLRLHTLLAKVEIK